jgi:hypothetical protein
MTDDNPADPTYFHCKNFANCGNNFFGDDLLSVTDGVESGKKVLEPGDDGNYKSSTSLTDILSCFTWFMVAIKSITNLPKKRHTFVRMPFILASL